MLFEVGVAAGGKSRGLKALSGPPQPALATLCRHVKAWRRGGLVHRSVARFTVNLLGCWPPEP